MDAISKDSRLPLSWKPSPKDRGRGERGKEGKRMKEMERNEKESFSITAAAAAAAVVPALTRCFSALLAAEDSFALSLSLSPVKGRS